MSPRARHWAELIHALALIGFLTFVVIAAEAEYVRGATTAQPCDTDSDCAARFGGDGGPGK